MVLEIKVEKLANAENEAKVTRIYKKAGEPIQAGEKLFDLEAKKGNNEVIVQYSGIIKEISVEVGEIVKLGKVIAVIATEEKIPETDNRVSVNNHSYFANMLKPIRKEVKCDIGILGGGPGGYVAAIQAAKLGAKVVLIEKDKVGGTCLNKGCIPTKAMVRSAEIFNNLNNASEFGCDVQKISIDIQKVVSRKNGIVKQLVSGIDYLLQQNKVDFVNGKGEILDKNTIAVKNGNSETIIKADNIIIATGSNTANLSIPGIDSPNVMTSEEILDLDKLPETLTIIGGGVIGMEFAFIFNSFGVEVSVIEYFGDCLTSLDDDLCQEITEIVKAKGIKLYTNSRVEKIENSENGKSIITFVKDNRSKHLVADKVLVSVGRIPCLEGINSAKLGLELTESLRGIKVNESMQTNIPNVYAIGDVTEKVMLAHVASHQGVIAVKNIMGDKGIMDYKVIPNAIFTDPEIAVVGISEKEAKEEGLSISVGKFPFSANGKALTLGEARGFIKLISEKETGRIIGGAIIGPHATDLIAEIALAVKNGLTARQIIETIHAHPTTAETVHEAALSIEGGAIHFA